MRTHNKSKLGAALKAFTECAREKKSVNLTTIASEIGYNVNSLCTFKEAVTHRFNTKEHGFTLDPIFEMTKEGNIKRLETPNNPKDATLLDIIAKAMTFINNVNNARRIEKKTKYDKEVSTKFMIDTLSKRGYLIYKRVSE